MAAPSPYEMEAIKKFRQGITDIPSSDKLSDMYCISWLRARDLDIKKATDMFRSNLAWRESEDIDNILDWEPPSHFPTDYDYEIVGEDGEGRPTLIAPFGEWDMRKATSNGEAATLLKYMTQIFAKIFKRAEESSERRGIAVTQFVLIVDSANLSMRQLTSVANVNIIFSWVRILEGNYPETLQACYVVNASRVLHLLFSMLKPLLSARTLSKIQIFTKPEKWQPVLLENLQASILPREFGGYRGGRRVSIGNIPYIDRSLTENLEHITTCVAAGKKFELAYTVTEPGSRLTWSFGTEFYDIGFSINFNRTEEILPAKRFESQVADHTGNLLCERPGEYFVVFDNTYSKMRGKNLHYLVQLVDISESEPEEEFKDAERHP